MKTKTNNNSGLIRFHTKLPNIDSEAGQVKNKINKRIKNNESINKMKKTKTNNNSGFIRFLTKLPDSDSEARQVKTDQHK